MKIPQKSWMYGVTTTHERVSTTLPKTLHSLGEAGFTNPRLFVDDCPYEADFEQFDLEVSYRCPRIRMFPNWMMGLSELYYRVPNADRYAIFQDDVVFIKNLRYYLDTIYFPENGYWNLYTYVNEKRFLQASPPSDDYVGFYESNQKGRGALALVFNRDMVIKILQSKHMANKVLHATKGYVRVDGAVIDAVTVDIGGKEYVHSPTLVSHTGASFSVKKQAPIRYPAELKFPGIDFDALSFLNEKPDIGNLGDIVESALSTVGITEDRITDWLGEECGCSKRKEKLNQLHGWAKRVMNGQIENAKKYLGQIIGDH